MCFQINLEIISFPKSISRLFSLSKHPSSSYPTDKLLLILQNSSNVIYSRTNHSHLAGAGGKVSREGFLRKDKLQTGCECPLWSSGLVPQSLSSHAQTPIPQSLQRLEGDGGGAGNDIDICLEGWGIGGGVGLALTCSLPACLRG